MKKYVKYTLLLILMIPIIVYAVNLYTFPDGKNHANNYITRFTDRNKYLLIPGPYIFENGVLSDDATFTSGGLLNKSEYDSTLVGNKSYLAIGKEYWLATSNGASKYYVDAYLDSKPESSKSGIRVTEFIKSSTEIEGKGTYSNPWIFKEGFVVDIITNSETYGVVSPRSRAVDAGGTAEFNVVPNTGYTYTGKDDCGLVRVGTTNRYKIENVRRDISCVAMFDLQTYELTLTSVHGYATSPNPSVLYYKMGKGFYKDRETKQSINKLTTLPTITGYIYNGYSYNGNEIIDSSGNITQTIPGMNYSVANQELTADLTPIQYNIEYNLNGGTNCGLSTIGTYDQVVTLCNPTRTGYVFAGWSVESGLNTNTARYGSTSSSVETSIASSSTVANVQYFKNLTATNNATVRMKANWTARTYTIGYTLDGGSYGTNHPTSGTYDENVTINNAGKTITLTFDVGSSGATISYTGGSSVSGNNQAVSYTFTGWNISGMDSVTHTLGSATTTSTTAAGITATTFKNLRSTEGTVTFAATFTPPTITLPAVTRRGYTCVWTSSGISNIASNGTYTPAASGGATSRTFTASCSINSYTCSSGQYLPANGIACTTCTDGNYCVSTNTTYNFNPTSNQGITSCTTLGSNYTRSDAGASSNTQCYIPVTAGYYKTTATGNVLQKCAVGNYKGAHSSYYNSSDSCSKCDAGKSCPEGSTVASACTSCAAGTYNTTAGSACSQCPKGKYCTGGTNNTNCPAGKYRDALGGKALSDCSNCAAGQGSAAGSTSSSACTACAAGTYNSTAGSACDTCPAGYFCTGGTNKTACPVGTYKSSTGGSAATACSNCSAGTSSPAGSTSSSACTSCAAGTYNTTAGSACAACPAGKYCTGGTNNTNCPVGTYRTSTGGKAVGDCSKCDAGKSSPAGSTAASACTTCAAGTYNTTAGSACAACPAGKYCTGGTNTTNCPKGTYRTSTGGKVVGDCTNCPTNTYNTNTGSTASSACTSCPTGYSSAAGSDAKADCTISCSANYRVNSADAQCTTACSTGYNHAAHSVSAGSTSTACSANTFTVAYNANGGSGTTASHTCTYDQACSLSANGFSRSGYAFDGWKRENSGSSLAAGTSIKNTVSSGTVTYYAQWKQNLITCKRSALCSSSTCDYSVRGCWTGCSKPDPSYNYVYSYDTNCFTNGNGVQMCRQFYYSCPSGWTYSGGYCYLYNQTSC